MYIMQAHSITQFIIANHKNPLSGGGNRETVNFQLERLNSFNCFKKTEKEIKLCP